MIRILSICGQCPRPKSNIAADDEYTLQMVESRLLWIWSSHSRAAESATTTVPYVLPYYYYCALSVALLTITAITEEPSQVLPAPAPGAAGSSPSQGFKLL